MYYKVRVANGCDKTVTTSIVGDLLFSQ